MGKEPQINPAISVVIPTLDRNHLLSRCLDRLMPELGPDDEVVVVDSASTTDDVRAVAEARGARYIRSDIRGTSLARNLGWRSSGNPIIGFIDDDVLVESGWAERLRAELSDGTTQFVIGSVHPDDEQRAGVRTILVDPNPVDIGRSTPGSMGLGCNGGALRSALESIGGYDERMGGGRFFSAEDVEVVDKLIGKQLPGRYEPGLRTVHIMHGDSGHAVKSQWYYGLGMGARYALLLRRDRERSRAVRADVFRLRGVKTLAVSTAGGERRAILPPLAFRAGALVGMFAAFVRLR